MKYLVDAKVLSEATRPDPDGSVLEWLQQHQAEIAIDPVILGEIRFGICLLPHGQNRERLERWFAEGISKVQCLAWQAETGLRWARLLADLRLAGNAMPVKDSLIAASALVHGLTVVTRNAADFRNAGVLVLDPFHGE